MSENRTVKHQKRSEWPSLELVVARYQENLNWLRRVPRRFQITVYDKGTDKGTDNSEVRRSVERVRLPNIGREEYAYLHHIVNRYDDLRDITVFSQGKPFDHVPDLHKILHAIAFRQIPVAGFHWFGFIIDEDDDAGSLLFQRWPCNPNREPLPMTLFWRELFGEVAPQRKSFYPSAHFAVTAACIRSRPRHFYERALSLSASQPHAGHCFERAWDTVFGTNGIPEQFRDQPKPIYLRKIRRLEQGSPEMSDISVQDL